MNNKRRNIIRIILGGYLAFLGARILLEVIQNKPSDGVIMGVLSVLFIAIGGTYAIFSIRHLIKTSKNENAGNTGLDQTQELKIPDVSEERMKIQTRKGNETNKTAKEDGVAEKGKNNSEVM